MGDQRLDLEPSNNIPLVDCHCHVPYLNPPRNIPKSYQEQYEEFFNSGGKFFISSAIDNKSVEFMIKYTQNHENCYLTAGFAPQTVTYSKKQNLEQEFQKWLDFIKNQPEKYVAIGEIGLDFHHAKTLKKRNIQIDYFKKIIEETIDLNKPYVLHVRNPSINDIDKENLDHHFNKPDAVNLQIVNILKGYDISPKKVMWHCFAGPSDWGEKLAEEGYILSVITSAFRSKKMRSYTMNVPISQLVTETDSYWQHPLQFRGFNMPINVKYAIASIAYTHQLDQKFVAEQILENASNFFNLHV